MVAVPPSGRGSVGALAAAAPRSRPPSAPSRSGAPAATPPTLHSSTPSVRASAPAPIHSSAPAPVPSSAPAPVPETLSFDPVEVVRLDFSPTASAGDDADTNLDTADLDLELSDVSESNFYSDVAGQSVGLFVATFVVKPPGTVISVRLSIPQLDGPILVSGTVHWVREFSPSIEAPPGMGLALKPLSPPHRHAVDAFLRARPAILHDD